MSLRSSSYLYPVPFLSLAAVLSAGCPGPEPSFTDDASGGADAQSTGIGPGPGPGPGPSSANGSAASGSSAKSSGAGVGGEGPGGAGGGGDGGRAEGGGGRGGGDGGHNGPGGGGEGGGCDDLGSVDSCGRCGRPCVLTNVAEDTEAACVGNVCEFTCADGFYNDVDPDEDAEVDDGCETRRRRVFVTEDTYGVPFIEDGGGEGAFDGDDICTALAEVRNLPGTWMSWTSDSTTAPKDRFLDTEGRARFVLVGAAETVVANGWEDLTDGSLDNAISITETANPLKDNVVVWTGTKADGSERSGSHCLDWGSPLDPEAQAGIGNSSFTNVGWSEGNIVACADEGQIATHHLYCFEQ